MNLDEVLQKLAHVRIVPDAPQPESHTCDICEGRGWYYDQPPIRNAGELPTPPTPCTCPVGQSFQRDQMRRRYTQSNIPAFFADASLETWGNAYKHWTMDQRAGKKLAYAAARALLSDNQISKHELARSFTMQGEQPAWAKRALAQPDVQRNSLVLYGGFGVGKSYLAYAILNDYCATGGTGTAFRAQEILLSLKETWNRDAESSEQQILTRFQTVPLLLVDDMNLEHNDGGTPHPWQRQYMQEIMRHRNYNRLCTIITTNLPPEEFRAHWDGWTAEAVLEMAHFIPVGGASVRQTAQDWSDE